MTLDKFGRHISQRYTDISYLEDSIYSNIEEKILKNLERDVKYVENKIIQNYEADLKYQIDSLKKKVNKNDVDVENMSKRVNENDVDVENISKRIKWFEDDVIPKHNNKILKFENDIQSTNAKYVELNNLERNMENEITEIKTIINDTSKIDKAKDEISKNMVSKFQSFTDKIYNRVAEEMENAKTVHDHMNKNIADIDKSIKVHSMVHKNDSAKVQELERKFITLDKRPKNSNDIDLITEKLKTIEAKSKNITQNSEKIQEILTDLHNLEGKILKEQQIALEALKAPMKKNELIINNIKDEILKKTNSELEIVKSLVENLEKKLDDKIKPNININNIKNEILTETNRELQIVKTLVANLETKLDDKFEQNEQNIKNIQGDIGTLQFVLDETRVNYTRYQKVIKDIQDFVKNTAAETKNSIINTRTDLNTAIENTTLQNSLQNVDLDTKINARSSELSSKIEELGNRVNKALENINNITEKVDKIDK